MTILPRGLDILDTFLYESFKHRTQIMLCPKLSSRGLSNTLISIVQITFWFDSVFTRLACLINVTESYRHKHDKRDLQLLDYNLGKYFEQKVNILGEIILFTVSAVKALGFQHI